MLREPTEQLVRLTVKLARWICTGVATLVALALFSPACKISDPTFCSWELALSSGMALVVGIL
ncbi:hypothetical protein [Enterobacter quasihormaechei]|uniref:hypothetical protein n=1 Tax=Enterobacter quasihormaechei TaxID=2529382 RepID=UPI002B1E2F68|nr:hypothetical protein [Enterobacter quasihormaechei]MEA3787117.1 hypothetical protein [Enterobacter quasihormaechei]MEA3873303.1 hypothetical protein [Enterobacter quasihormaechei]